jgi:ATP-dependent Clp protease ATP-binding subunit ClpB
VDFKNTVIIMTSNLGSEFLGAAHQADEADFEEARAKVMGVLQSHFRPEFLNRVDDIVIFRPLGEEQLTQIVDLRLRDLEKLLADRKIHIELTKSAKDLLFMEGYDRAYGARPLKRAIQKLIQDPLALKLLEGEVQTGDTVRVEGDLGSRKMVFQVSPSPGREPAVKEEELRAS